MDKVAIQDLVEHVNTEHYSYHDPGDRSTSCPACEFTRLVAALVEGVTGGCPEAGIEPAIILDYSEPIRSMAWREFGLLTRWLTQAWDMCETVGDLVDLWDALTKEDSDEKD